jgi:hypothetical protein
MNGWFSRDAAEWLLNLWLRLRANRLARYAGLLILAAIAAMSNAIQLVIVGLFGLAGQTIHVPETPWWVVIVFIAVAAVLLIFDRLFPAGLALPNKNDIDLYSKFQTVFTDRVRRFLDEHSFGDDWAAHETDALFRFEYEWKGARYRFQDKELDAALDLVKRKCDELVSKIAQYSAPARDGVPRMTIKTNRDRDEGMSQRTIANMNELNDTATDLKDLIDALELLARNKFG